MMIRGNFSAFGGGLKELNVVEDEEMYRQQNALRLLRKAVKTNMAGTRHHWQGCSYCRCQAAIHSTRLNSSITPLFLRLNV
jgi:hypothetical protein